MVSEFTSIAIKPRLVSLSMFLILVKDVPRLSVRVIWLIGIDVLIGSYHILIDVQSKASEPICKLHCSNIVLESLVVETSVVIDDDVSIETFKKSSTLLTHGSY